jgi:hypothetical protein
LQAAAVERDRRADAGHLERCREIAILADRGSPKGEVVAWLGRRGLDGGEIVLGLAAGMLGRWSNPNARAISTSRRRAPSGANAELHDTVNASVKDLPQASRPAFRSSPPDNVA